MRVPAATGVSRVAARLLGRLSPKLLMLSSVKSDQSEKDIKAGWSLRQTVAGLFVMVVCIIGAIILKKNSALCLIMNVLFWFCLGFLLTKDRGIRDNARYFIPLIPLYYLTFYFNRDVVELWDKIFNSDTPRYLAEATNSVIQVRHMGFPVLIFPYSFLNDVGLMLFNIPNLGREYLYIEIALIGTIAVTVFSRLVSCYESSRTITILASYSLALSLAFWSLSSVIDTFVVSTMLFMLFLLHVREYYETGSIERCISLALITVIALALSLENGYFVVLFGFALTYNKLVEKRMSNWAHGVLYLGIVALGFVLMLKIAEITVGPNFYHTSGDRKFAMPATNLVENLYHYTSRFLDVKGGMSVSELLKGGFRIFVMSVSAQHGTPVDQYYIDSRMLLSVSSVGYISLSVAIIAMSVIGLIADGRREMRFLVSVILLAQAIRFMFTAVYNRQDSTLFSTPSLAMFWLLIGFGLNSYLGGAKRLSGRLSGIFLALVCGFLLVNNGWYLLGIK